MTVIPTTPVADPIFAHILAERWYREGISEDPKEHAYPDTIVRHSDAAACSRRLQYQIQHIEPTNPPDLTAYWAFGIGRIIHDLWQQEAARRWPDAEIELKVRPDPESPSSGHVDLTLRGADGLPPVVVVEGKTVGGYSYKKAIGVPVGRGKSVAEGPKWSAIVQGAVNAWCEDADLMVVVNWSKEAVSGGLAAKHGLPDHMRICAEWHYDRSEYVPIAEAELKRWHDIAERASAGEYLPRYVPSPEIPDDAVIVDPVESRWRSPSGGSGKVWAGQMCKHYCTMFDRCMADLKAGR